MTYLDDVLSRHDLLTVQALALTAMYSFRAEVSHSVESPKCTDAVSGWPIGVVRVD